MVNILYVKNNTLVSRSVSNDARDYHQFCTMFGLKQVIKSPARITYRNTFLIDNILATITSRISQHGVNNVMLVYRTINLSTVQEKFVKPKQGVFTNI